MGRYERMEGVGMSGNTVYSFSFHSLILSNLVTLYSSPARALLQRPA